MSNEKKASGISPEKQSELDSLLEDLIERENIAEEEINENQRKVDEEKIKVTEVGQQAMEKLAETKRRQEGAEDKPSKKRSRSGSEAIEFLRSQCEKSKLKEMELESRRKQEEAESIRNENAQKRHEALMQMFTEQQGMMAQQNQTMMSIIAHMIKK